MSAATPEPRRRPGRPPRAVSGPRIEARLLAAMERLLAQGTPFAAVSVEALVAEAGIARATFYTHFKDKPALVARWLSRISDDVVASGGEWFEGDGPVSPGQVKTALMGIVAAFGRHQAIFAAVAATSRAKNSISRSKEASQVLARVASTSALERLKITMMIT